MAGASAKLLILIVCALVPARASDCTNFVSVHGVEFTCDRISSLGENLMKAQGNTGVITVQNSKLIVVPNKSFMTFSATLKTLDIHESDVRTIETDAFWGLVNLEKLSLWGNNLTWVPADWFTHLTNLRIFDLSFNRIYGIDVNIYDRLFFLTDFYFDNNNLKQIDYNFFPVLTHLRKVEFGNNPWSWIYRALLTWQLDNQRVDYRDSWDDWGWMSEIIKECQDNGYAVMPDEKLLICTFKKLLEFAKTLGSASLSGGQTSLNNQNSLSIQTFMQFHQCVKRNGNANGDELLLKLMEAMFHELILTDNPQAMFHR